MCMSPREGWGERAGGAGTGGISIGGAGRNERGEGAGDGGSPGGGGRVCPGVGGARGNRCIGRPKGGKGTGGSIGPSGRDGARPRRCGSLGPREGGTGRIRGIGRPQGGEGAAGSGVGCVGGSGLPRGRRSSGEGLGRCDWRQRDGGCIRYGGGRCGGVGKLTGGVGFGGGISVSRRHGGGKCMGSRADPNVRNWQDISAVPGMGQVVHIFKRAQHVVVVDILVILTRNHHRPFEDRHNPVVATSIVVLVKGQNK